MLGIVADGDFERLDPAPYGDRVGRDDDLFDEPLRAALSQNQVIGPDIWPMVDRRLWSVEGRVPALLSPLAV